jgi:hypothetical protein
MTERLLVLMYFLGDHYCLKFNDSITIEQTTKEITL